MRPLRAIGSGCVVAFALAFLFAGCGRQPQTVNSIETIVGWKTNGDIAIGRFRYVKTAWQAFNMTTLSEEALRENPPPLE